MRSRIALDAVIETILEDVKISSRVKDALDHPLFLWMKSVDDREGILRALFKELLQVPTSGAHLMGMIFDLNGDQPAIPERERGVIAAMRARLLTWGRAEGFLPGGVPENKRVIHVLRAGMAVCGKRGLPREWSAEHWWVAESDVKQSNCPGCRKALQKEAV